MILNWKTFSNLENSFAEFLQDAIDTDSIQVIDENGTPKDVMVRVGWEFDSDWTLPCISLYEDSRTLERAVIGGNTRIKNDLVIIDIRATNDKQRSAIANWIEETINNGFPYYEYTANPSDVENPTKNHTGNVSLDFIFNSPVRLGENSDLIDKFRHNITVSINIQ